MIYQDKPRYFILLYTLILGGPLFYMGGFLWRIVFAIIFLYGVYVFTEDKINERGISKRRVLVFYTTFIPFSKIDKVVCPCLPRMSQGGKISNPLYFYYGKKYMQFDSVFSDDRASIANVKRILTFLESKGVKVYLYVPSGEEKRQIFTGFEVIKNLPDEPVIWF